VNPAASPPRRKLVGLMTASLDIQNNHTTELIIALEQ
jgi:hypothetical protein